MWKPSFSLYIKQTHTQYNLFTLCLMWLNRSSHESVVFNSVYPHLPWSLNFILWSLQWMIQNLSSPIGASTLRLLLTCKINRATGWFGKEVTDYIVDAMPPIAVYIFCVRIYIVGYYYSFILSLIFNVAFMFSANHWTNALRSLFILTNFVHIWYAFFIETYYSKARKSYIIIIVF